MCTLQIMKWVYLLSKQKQEMNGDGILLWKVRRKCESYKLLHLEMCSTFNFSRWQDDRNDRDTWLLRIQEIFLAWDLGTHFS